MFERFTERARQVVILAQEESRKRQHSYIGTEHVLLGLVREEEGLASRVLESFDVDEAVVARSVSAKVSDGEMPLADDERGVFTPRAKKVLELALREALSLGHNYVGTEHILLGLIREPDGVGQRILKEEIGDGYVETIRNEVIRMLSGIRSRRVKMAVGKVDSHEYDLADSEEALSDQREEWVVETYFPGYGSSFLGNFSQRPSFASHHELDSIVITGGDADPTIVAPQTVTIVIKKLS